MKQNLILIGFMGAGKTTIGKLFAKQYGLPLVDTDQLITEKAGMTIPEIFEYRGEEVFRQYETQVLKELFAENGGAVISVGGGLPLREENRRILRQLGLVIYLDITNDTVWNRLRGQTGRPLLEGEHAEQKIAELLSLRRPIYEQAAHQTICADAKSPAAIVEELREMAGDIL